MMSQVSPAKIGLRCPRCNAQQPAEARLCWLCGARLSAPADSAQVARAPLEPAGGFSLASLMMFVTLVSVVLGVSTIAPGIGIPLGVILLVVWLRTAAVTRHRAARGLAATWTEKVELFVSSFAVSLALITLLAIAGSAAFFAACLACIVTGEELQLREAQWYVFWSVVAAIMGPALYWAGRWVYRRWRHDIGEPD